MASSRSNRAVTEMRFLCTILAVIASITLVACSGSDPVTPDVQKTVLRFYNGNTSASRIEINNTEVFPTLTSGAVSGAVSVDPSTDTVEVRAVHSATNAIVARRRVTLQPISYSIVLFPSVSIFNCARRPEECIVHENASAPPAGRARIRVINATKDGTELSLKIDAMEVLNKQQLAVCSISNVVDIEAGEHNLAVARTTNEQYDAAYRIVNLKAGASYTLMLSGSLAFDDNYAFRAQLHHESEEATDAVDLIIPPDVGKYQIVHAVTGLKELEARLDGSPKPQTERIPFAQTSGYVDLEIGTHTTGIFGNGTPLIQETRTTTTLRSRKTLFVTGSMVPPNLAGIEVADLVQPLSQNSATIRIMNLSPDSPALDFYRIVNGVEVVIDGCALLEFRQMTKTANGTMQFTELPAGRITVLAKKANSQTVVLPPTQITLVPGEISTLWLGGLSAAPQLYHVQHN